MYRISKEYHFSSSHQLPHLPESHKCHHLHGHNYVAIVILESETLNEDGFVRDYHELDALKTYIDDKLDHKHLNDVLGDDCVTAEQIAKHLYDWAHARWPEVAAVQIKETPKTTAEYRGS